MEETALDPLLASKEQMGSTGVGAGGAPLAASPAWAALWDPGRGCREDPGHSASHGAGLTSGEKCPQQGSPIGGLINMRHLLDGNLGLLNLEPLAREVGLFLPRGPSWALSAFSSKPANNTLPFG